MNLDTTEYFSAQEIEKTWKQLIDLGPRFPGTENEVLAKKFIISAMDNVADTVSEHEYNYLGWSLRSKPKLRISSPSPYEFPCEAFIYCNPTPPSGIVGKLQYIGKHRIIGAYEWEKFAVISSTGEIVAYISGRPDGPAQPQPLDRASSPKPHFIVGEHELRLLLTWVNRGLDIVVEGKIDCKVDPKAKSSNIVASFNPNLTDGRIIICAHYDSMYDCPGANDNAGGVTALILLATHIRKHFPEIPIDFIFFCGEEWELAGSRPYVNDNISKINASSIKFLLNLDGISEGDHLSFWVGPEEFEAKLKNIVDKFSHHRKVNKTFYFPPPLGSDHIPFYLAGVPVCMISFGDMVKYHLNEDKYCFEGIENIHYVTELSWHIINTFMNQEIRWNTIQGRLTPNKPSSWI